jgi:orotate phosphoribosyltransferase
MQDTLPHWKARFLQATVNAGILRFGTFELKSKRQSPYFFNAGDFYQANLLDEIGTAFAHAIIEARKKSNMAFDVIFGPAYKGIPLATATALKLASIEPHHYADVCYAYDRKEVKDHGEGGMIVGAPLKGKRVLIVDDVITAGTAKREAIGKIVAEGGIVVGIVVALDRKEKLPGPDGDNACPMPSAMGELRKEFQIPIVSVLSLDDIIDGIGDGISAHNLSQLKRYRTEYAPTEDASLS